MSLEHCHAAMTYVISRAAWVSVMPYLMAGSRVDGPNIFRNSKVQNAVHQQRGRLDGCDLVCLEGPCERKILHVLRCDLSERAVTLAGIIAVIAGPTVG